MIVTKTDLPGVYIIDIERKEDARGFFARVTCVDEFATHGFSFQPVQASIAWNIRRGTVRGLHYQAPPHAEAKIVRCTAGAIYDVLLDMRKVSPTYGRWIGLELREADVNVEAARRCNSPAAIANNVERSRDNLLPIGHPVQNSSLDLDLRPSDAVKALLPNDRTIALHNNVAVSGDGGVAVAAAASSDSVLRQNGSDGFLNVWTTASANDRNAAFKFAAKGAAAEDCFEQRGS